MRLSRSRSSWYLANSDRASTSRRSSTIPSTSCGLDAAGDDPLRELARVGLQVLDAAGLQRVHVVVVDLGRLGEDLLVRHHAAGAPPR